jgi:hypothetical protein
VGKQEELPGEEAGAGGGKRRAAICENLCSSSFFLEAMASPPYTRARKKNTPTTDCSPTNCSHLLLAASDTIVQAILTPISKTQEQEQEQENQIVAEGENTKSSGYDAINGLVA